MKKLIFVLIIILSTNMSFSQKLIKNSHTPKGLEKERILDSQTILCIPDVGDEYYIETNFGSRIDNEGNIFVLDKSKVLKFDKEGQFLKQFSLPEVLPTFNGFGVDDSNIIVFNRHPLKPSVLVFNHKTGEKKNFELPDRRSVFVCYENKQVYLIGNSLTSLSIETGEITPVSNLRLNVVETILEGGAVAQLTRDTKAAMLSNSEMLISNTEEYEVKVLDIVSGKVKKKFTRKYERVPNKAVMGGFQAKFTDDINKIISRENEIWIITSSFDQQKGYLVDVFNTEGRYMDRFYLRYSNGESALRFQFKDIRYNEMLINVREEGQSFSLYKLRF